MLSKTISFNLNGKKEIVDIDLRETLLEVLRYKLGLTGTKCGCNVGECGACTVIIDGETIDTCLYLAVWADGKDVTTIEGLEKDGELSKVQKAFVDEGAVQCGFCTPGFIMSATVLVERGEKLCEEEIRRELSGNLCRCTGYQKIISAVSKALN